MDQYYQTAAYFAQIGARRLIRKQLDRPSAALPWKALSRSYEIVADKKDGDVHAPDRTKQVTPRRRSPYDTQLALDKPPAAAKTSPPG